MIRWCCALQTIRKLAFLFSTKLKEVLLSWNLPKAILIEKKWSYYFFSSYRVYVCNSSTFEIR